MLGGRWGLACCAFQSWGRCTREGRTGDVSEGRKGISPTCCCFEQAVPACVQVGRRHAAGLDHAAPCLPTRLPLSIIVGLRRNNACTACVYIYIPYTVSTYLVPVFHHRMRSARLAAHASSSCSLVTLSSSTIIIIITPSLISSSRTSHRKNKAQIPPKPRHSQPYPTLPNPSNARNALPFHPTKTQSKPRNKSADQNQNPTPTCFAARLARLTTTGTSHPHPRWPDVTNGL